MRTTNLKAGTDSSTIVEPDATVVTEHDEDGRVLISRRQAAVLRGSAQVALAVVIDRHCVPGRGYALPQLITFVEIFDEQFAVEISDVYEVRRGRGAKGTFAGPVVVAHSDGSRTECEIHPPFTVEGPQRESEFLLKEVSTNP